MYTDIRLILYLWEKRVGIVKSLLQISDDELREKIIEYMIAYDMNPETFSKHCGLSNGKVIKTFINNDRKPLFMTRVKIINGLTK